MKHFLVTIFLVLSVFVHGGTKDPDSIYVLIPAHKYYQERGFVLFADRVAVTDTSHVTVKDQKYWAYTVQPTAKLIMFLDDRGYYSIDHLNESLFKKTSNKPKSLKNKKAWSMKSWKEIKERFKLQSPSRRYRVSYSNENQAILTKYKASLKIKTGADSLEFRSINLDGVTLTNVFVKQDDTLSISITSPGREFSGKWSSHYITGGGEKHFEIPDETFRALYSGDFICTLGIPKDLWKLLSQEIKIFSTNDKILTFNVFDTLVLFEERLSRRQESAKLRFRGLTPQDKMMEFNIWENLVSVDSIHIPSEHLWSKLALDLNDLEFNEIVIPELHAVYFRNPERFKVKFSDEDLSNRNFSWKKDESSLIVRGLRVKLDSAFTLQVINAEQEILLSIETVNQALYEDLVFEEIKNGKMGSVSIEYRWAQLNEAWVDEMRNRKFDQGFRFTLPEPYASVLPNQIINIDGKDQKINKDGALTHQLGNEESIELDFSKLSRSSVFRNETITISTAQLASNNFNINAEMLKNVMIPHYEVNFSGEDDWFESEVVYSKKLSDVVSPYGPYDYTSEEGILKIQALLEDYEDVMDIGYNKQEQRFTIYFKRLTEEKSYFINIPDHAYPPNKKVIPTVRFLDQSGNPLGIVQGKSGAARIKKNREDKVVVQISFPMERGNGSKCTNCEYSADGYTYSSTFDKNDININLNYEVVPPMKYYFFDGLYNRDNEVIRNNLDMLLRDKSDFCVTIFYGPDNYQDIFSWEGDIQERFDALFQRTRDYDNLTNNSNYIVGPAQDIVAHMQKVTDASYNYEINRKVNCTLFLSYDTSYDLERELKKNPIQDAEYEIEIY